MCFFFGEFHVQIGFGAFWRPRLSKTLGQKKIIFHFLISLDGLIPDTIFLCPLLPTYLGYVVTKVLLETPSQKRAGWISETVLQHPGKKSKKKRKINSKTQKKKKKNMRKRKRKEIKSPFLGKKKTTSGLGEVPQNKDLLKKDALRRGLWSASCLIDTKSPHFHPPRVCRDTQKASFFCVSRRNLPFHPIEVVRGRKKGGILLPENISVVEKPGGGSQMDTHCFEIKKKSNLVFLLDLHAPAYILWIEVWTFPIP